MPLDPWFGGAIIDLYYYLDFEHASKMKNGGLVNNSKPPF